MDPQMRQLCEVIRAWSITTAEATFAFDAFGAALRELHDEP
jgi:hypothetical protein